MDEFVRCRHKEVNIEEIKVNEIREDFFVLQVDDLSP